VDVNQKAVALVLVFNTVEDDSRVLREARTLRALGIDVVICGVVSAEDQRTEVFVDGVRVVRLTPGESVRRLLGRQRRARALDAEGGGSAARGSAPAAEPRFAGLRRLVIALAYWLQGVALVRRLSPALVHANDYNTMWVGVAAKLLRGSRLVYDAHELWPDRYGRREWRPWLVACEWLFVRVADATITVSPGCADVLAKRYRIPTPVVIRNIPDLVTEPAGAEGLRANLPPLAVYVGVLAPGRGIEETILALAPVPELRLRLMGRVSEEYWTRLGRLAEENGVANRVEYRSPVEAASVADTIAGADFGIALIQPICLSNELSLPNKMFEYTAAGLPVLGSDLPVIAAVVRGENIGEVVPPSDIGAIAEALRRLSDPDRNAQLRRQVQAFARRANWQTERPLLEQIYSGKGSDG
jgi:glycosyltransferase involved in cell wall biosynthesis